MDENEFRAVMLGYAAIIDTMKVVTRELIISAADGDSGDQLLRQVRERSLMAVSRAQVNEQDHAASVRRSMLSFHAEFFRELDAALQEKRSQPKR